MVAAFIGDRQHLTVRKMAELSELQAGSVSVMNYASTLFRFPSLLVGISIGAALLPSLSEAVSQNAHELFMGRFFRGMKITLLFSALMSAFFLFYGEDFIRILYQRGAFDASAAHRTAVVLGVFTVGFFALTAYPVVARTLNALHLNIALFAVFASGLVVKYCCYTYLFRASGVEGIAWAGVVSTIMIFALSFWILSRRLGPGHVRAFVASLWPLMAVSAVSFSLGILGYRMIALAVLLAFILLANPQERSLAVRLVKTKLGISRTP